MKPFEYVVVKYVPNVLRDESVNVGAIVRDPAGGDFAFKFLQRGGAVRKLWPAADTNIVRHVERQLVRTRDQLQLSLDPQGLGQSGSPRDPGFFGRARHEFTGNLQLTPERGMAADNLDEALGWAYSTFVAEPPATARPINYQALAPMQVRERVWKTFEKRELIGPRRVRERVVLEGRHAPWTFDLVYKNGTLNLINSLALSAGPEANLGRALVLKGMVDEIRDKQSQDVQGLAVVQFARNASSGEAAASRQAIDILTDAAIRTYDLKDVELLVDEVERDLQRQPHGGRSPR